MNMVKRKESMAAPIVMPEDIRRQLAELEKRQLTLTREGSDLAEKSVGDGAEAAEAEKLYKANCDESVRVDGEIRRLTTALAGMETKAAAARTAEQEATVAAARGRVRELLDQRLAAASAFEAAITEAVDALHMLAGLSETAYLAWPGSQPDPTGMALSKPELSRLVAAELFRQGGVPLATGGAVVQQEMSLPAPKSPSFEYVSRPSAVPQLTATIGAANDVARDILEGKR